MQFEHDEELLDWDMETDQNFEEVLNVDEQRVSQATRSKRPQQVSARSAKTWVRLAQSNYDGVGAPMPSEHRRSGDGDSIASQDMDEINGKSPPGSLKANSQASGTSDADDDHSGNSFSKYARQYDQNGGKGFTILEEDDADITSYDISPMEFRGTLKTGNPPYKSEVSCCCVFLRYFSVAFLALTLGIVIGYFIASSKILEIHVNESLPLATTTSTRDMTNHAIVDTVNSTIVSPASSATVQGTMKNNSIF